MRPFTFATLLFAGLLLVAAPSASAGEVTKTFDFELDEWHDVAYTDGPITIHRIRLDRVEGRFTKSSVWRPHNNENLDTIRITIEYTNTDSKGWKARVTTRWFDGEDRLIDGFGANESFNKNSARKTVEVSVPTLTYGIDRAEKLELSVHFKR